MAAETVTGTLGQPAVGWSCLAAIGAEDGWLVVRWELC